MTVADEGRLGILGTVRKRRLVLALVVVISVLAALPFALSVPPQYESSAQVLIPASDPISMGGNGVSRVSLELAAYASSSLAQDVRGSLGDQAAGLRSITAVSLRDQDTWLVTGLGSSPTVAQRAVSVAAQALISRSNDLAETMVRSLAANVTPALARLDLTMSTLSSRIVSLQQRERALSRKIARLRQSGTTDGVLALQTKLGELRTQRRQDAVSLDLARSKSSAYPGMMQTAYESLQQRIAASAVISPPPLGKRSAPVGLVATIGLAVLAGLLVGVFLILLIERRSYRRARRIDGSSVSAIGRTETDEPPDVVSSLGSTRLGGE